MLSITQGMTRTSLNSMDQYTFDNYDKDGDGVISYSEYANFVSVSGIGQTNQTNQVNKKQPDKYSQKFNFEQFEPTGSINFESNGGYNSTRLNILA